MVYLSPVEIDLQAKMHFLYRYVDEKESAKYAKNMKD